MGLSFVFVRQRQPLEIFKRWIMNVHIYSKSDSFETSAVFSPTFLYKEILEMKVDSFKILEPVRIPEDKS